MSYWVGKVTEIRVTKDDFAWLLIQWYFRKADVNDYSVTINGDPGTSQKKAIDVLINQLGDSEVVKSDSWDVVSPMTVKEVVSLIQLPDNATVVLKPSKGVLFSRFDATVNASERKMNIQTSYKGFEGFSSI
ncbi:hypothetical protein CPB83DRAFT_423061 [Crepidotus variabilis]|uniref:Uncharacterized protein n=1 Tax=Crepidotus variabilis TaxID=179855 RepID=A0A9P6ES82_9AGAR|nr:hypothetical protein CPB83DRAFT_423061 [Crepidotus variabilis]